MNEIILGEKSYLYVDVGGGSTEYTFFSKGKIIASKSFKIGTVRDIDKKNKELLLKKMKIWISENSENLSELFKKDVSILQADAYYLCGPAKMITDINLSTTKNHHNIRKWKRIWFYG